MAWPRSPIWSLCWACFVMCWFCSNVQGDRVLVYGMPHGQSHLFLTKKFATTMAARGHTVTVVLAQGDEPILAKHGELSSLNFNVSSYPISDPMNPQLIMKTLSNLSGIRKNMAVMDTAFKLLWELCSQMLGNGEFMVGLKAFDGDVLVADPLLPCGALLAAKLDVPLVSLHSSSVMDPLLGTWWSGSGREAHIPNPLAYNPQMGTGLPQNMTFMQRMWNVLSYLRIQAHDYRVMRRDQQRIARAHGIDLRSARERAREVLLIFPISFAVDYPRPILPNTVFVGPILPEPARPLPADLQDFMDGSGERGVLVVSMGTVVSFSEEEIDSVAATLKALPVHSLWKVNKAELSDEKIAALQLPPSIKVVRWMPQNDVLGCSATRAFLTHGGANGMYEAAFHGVPLVGRASFGDQMDNLAKAQYKGFGLRLPDGPLRRAEVEPALRRVLTEPSFAAAARRVQRALRARPRPAVVEAAEWVEHMVATRGEPYLKTPSDRLSWPARHLLDVAAAWAALAAAVAACPLLAVRWAWALLLRRQHAGWTAAGGKRHEE